MKPSSCLVAALLVGMTVGCDSTNDAPSSLVGTYALVEAGGTALPSGGVTSGQLRLRIDNTVPVYDAEWTANGVREVRGGLFSVAGSSIEFTETSGSSVASYVGQVDGDRIRVSFGPPTFAFERD